MKQLISILHYLWKIPLCGLLFFLGFIPGGALATWLGFATPAMPAGADSAIVVQYTLLASLFMALSLAFLSQGLAGGFWVRWPLLFFLIWITYGVNTYLEAAIFSTMAAASLYTVVLYFPAALLCSAALALLFRPATQTPGFPAKVKDFFAGRSGLDWAGRLLLAALAFPAAYLFFGTIISPIVLPYYQAGANELALPGWGEIIPILALRSLLFVITCLPILMVWHSSNWRLFFALGIALFILVGGMGMLEAYWLPAILRVVHSLEIFADEMVYAAALVWLLRKPVVSAANAGPVIQHTQKPVTP